MPRHYDSETVEKCLQVLKSKAPRTKLLTSDLVAEAGIASTHNVVMKLNRLVAYGKLCKDKIGHKHILWYLPDRYWTGEPELAPKVEPEPKPEPLPDTVYKRETPSMGSRPSIPENFEYLRRISRFRKMPNQKVALQALMDSANPVVTGDPHDALCQLMATARHLYNIKGEPFLPAAVDLHIAMELRRVVEFIEEATTNLQSAIETLQQLRN